ncbi:uncharacterized protein LOC126367399 [Pectinophora gossypiella]|uniref:uncharacterized protein LOC126367399 n=1 Tax=Pectinophora gossypiella TaxID=13191 RepID=UPI00214E71D8|nr:uncharacterized protein LOC126367399 [Pectinophora gossypiella]
MNWNFMFAGRQDEPNGWTRASNTLNKWLWGALCCGLPGVPCYFCSCCERRDATGERERPSVNQATATAERMMRPHRPHAPTGRKCTPETLSAVRCALSQLQGEPAPPKLTAVAQPQHIQVQPG